MTSNAALISTTILVVFSIGIGFYFLKKKRRNNEIPKEWKKIGNVRKLYIFPLKSACYMEIDETECTELGFRLMKSETNPMQLRDRSFVVYGEKDQVIKSGRAIPSLVKIQLSVYDGTHIDLDAPNMEKIRVKIPSRESSKITFTKDWSGDKIETLDCGDEVARWLSHQISQQTTGYRLGFHDASNRRKFIGQMKDFKFYQYLTDAATGLFSDLTSIMIVNKASVDDCAFKVSSEKITPLNFRGNIVVDGPDVKPFDEDNWGWMKIGDVIMRNVKECTRCAFTNVDPETGIRSARKEPVKTLSSYRMSRGPENVPVMGIHMEVKKIGIIRSGDPVHVGCN